MKSCMKSETKLLAEMVGSVACLVRTIVDDQTGTQRKFGRELRIKRKQRLRLEPAVQCRRMVRLEMLGQTKPIPSACRRSIIFPATLVVQSCLIRLFYTRLRTPPVTLLSGAFFFVLLDPFVDV